MFVTKVRLKNVKCFSDLTIDFGEPAEAGRTGGWYVLVGPNGMGKSTILRAIALALGEGPSSPGRDFYEWAGAPLGAAGVSLGLVLLSGPGGRGVQTTHRLTVGPGSAGCEYRRARFREARLRTGVVMAGYGAFRRVGGRQGRGVSWRGEHGAFASLFEDDVALDATRWLIEAESRSRLSDGAAADPYRALLAGVPRLVNSGGIMPPGFRMLPLSPEGVRFVDPLGRTVGLADLGDGYRSIVGLVLCLLRDLFRWQPGDEETGAFGSLGADSANAEDVARTPGVVLIDEPDAHLHPEWQRRIGFALQDVFPNIQFIVATHSPFICQAASPGGIRELRLNREENRIEVVEPARTVRGWHIQDVYQKALGVDSWLDLDTEALIHEHAELVAASQTRELDPEERRRLIELEAHLDATVVAPGRSPEERETLDRLRRLTRQLQSKVEGGGGAG